MTDLRKKRLLLLASQLRGDHKKYYPQYYELSRKGLTGWLVGFAYLTPAGKLELVRLQGERND